MGRFDPKLSDDMRASLVRAQLADGLSAAEAVRAAAAGELGEPFEVARKTIARVAALEAPTSKDLHALQVAQRIVDGAERKARDRPPESAHEAPRGSCRLSRGRFSASWTRRSRPEPKGGLARAACPCRGHGITTRTPTRSVTAAGYRSRRDRSQPIRSRGTNAAERASGSAPRRRAPTAIGTV